MAATVDLSKLSVDEKLRLMEDLWEDLSKVERDVVSPAWHGDVLEERNRLVQSGEEAYVDWDEAKRKLRSELL